MNRKELLERLRSPLYLRDFKPPYLWSDDTLTTALNEAQREAALRAGLTRQDRLEVPVTAGEAVAAFPGGVVVLEVLPNRVWLDSKPDVALIEYSIRTRRQLSLMRDKAPGTPRFYALDVVDDYGGRAIRLDPVPDRDDTLCLDVTRLPYDLLSDSDEPEIHGAWHADLLDWAAKLALGDATLDTFDEKRAAQYEASFERKFGPRLSALELNRRQTEEPLTMIVE